jgi:putative methyltransferase (TIGR04325 family)
VETIRAKTIRFRDELEAGIAPRLADTHLHLLAALTLLPNRPIRVLDFGGACGTLYFVTRALLPGRIAEWTVVETPAMVAAATDLADGALAFTTEFPPETDLVWSSGTLQSVPDPASAMAGMLAIDAPLVCLTRLDWGKGEITIQRSRLSENGPGPLPARVADAWIEYPRTALVRRELREQLERTHRVIIRFDSGWLAAPIKGRD